MWRGGIFKWVFVAQSFRVWSATALNKVIKLIHFSMSTPPMHTCMHVHLHTYTLSKWQWRQLSQPRMYRGPTSFSSPSQLPSTIILIREDEESCANNPDKLKWVWKVHPGPLETFTKDHKAAVWSSLHREERSQETVCADLYEIETGNS